MKNQMPFLLLLILISLLACKGEVQEDTVKVEAGEISWQSFNDERFSEAKDNDKLVFLEVGANWCHWCHVMDDSTYSNAAVQSYLKTHFILCREDQDARPDLFAAYQPWGWPAIIVFNAAGEELLRLKGYQPPARFLTDLKSVVTNPIPLEKSSTGQGLATSIDATNQALLNKFMGEVDHQLGGYPWNNKSLDLSGIVHGLRYGYSNDSLKNWVNKTVENSYLLVDPVWSGVYQYSAKRSWNNQHYEKLLRFQANYMEAYCRYGSLNKDPKAIEMAEGILAYCKRFLKGDSPLYWNSQNADLVAGEHSGDYYGLNEKERLAEGVPSVDEKIYLKENASMINAQVWLWAATKKKSYLDEGKTMLDYALVHFATDRGIYAREKGQIAIFSFEDNRRLIESLMLYSQVTNDPIYLKEAQRLGQACIEEFKSPNGIASAIGDVAINSAIVQKDNLEAVLTYNKLSYLCHDNTFKTFAKETLALLDQQKLANSPATLPLLIRAKIELATEPFHAKFISSAAKKDLRTSYLTTLLMDKNPYFIFETLEPGKMNAEDESFYGGFDPGTLFMCTSSFCSAPIEKNDDLIRFLIGQQ